MIFKELQQNQFNATKEIYKSQGRHKIKKPHLYWDGVLKINPGSDLLSHTVASAVPSALRGLTAVFEMGTGVSPSLLPPENLLRRAVSASLPKQR